MRSHSFHLVDQLQDQHKPPSKAVEFGLHQARQCTAIPSTQLGYVAFPRAQRRPSSDALSKQQRFHPVLKALSLLDQMLTLAVRSFGIFVLRRRHTHDTAYLAITAEPGCQYAQHAFGIEPIGLGPTGASVHEDAGRLEHVGNGAMRC